MRDYGGFTETIQTADRWPYTRLLWENSCPGDWSLFFFLLFLIFFFIFGLAQELRWVQVIKKFGMLKKTRNKQRQKKNYTYLNIFYI